MRVSIYSLGLTPFLRDYKTHVPHTCLPARHLMIRIVPSTQSSDAVSRIHFPELSRISRHVSPTFRDANRASHIYILFVLTLKNMNFFFLGRAPCSLVDWHGSVGEIYLPTYTALPPRIRQSE